MKWFVILITTMIILVGCGVGEQNGTSSPNNEYENKTEGIAQNDEFTFRLVSEKAVYQVGEPLQIQAELTYIGNEDAIKIAHAASPIWLLTTNLTKNYQFEAAMNEPLIITELKKNEPFIEMYQFSGGSYYEGAPGNRYSDEEFMKMANEDFPPGQYEIKGRTDFAIGEDIMSERIHLETSIIFTVVD